MSITRQRQGFRHAGQIRPDQLGLPRATAKQLHLAWAWRQVAGAALARRTPALRLCRGVLEIRVPDGPWARALTELIPRLAARMAAAHPELGLRKFRLLRGEGQPLAGPLPQDVPPEPPAPSPRPAAAPAEPGATTGQAPEPLGLRLPDLARAYLARTPGPDPSP